MLSHDLTTYQLLNKIASASRALHTQEEAGCPPCARRHLAACRAPIAEELGRSGGPGRTAAGVGAASRRRARPPVPAQRSLPFALIPSVLARSRCSRVLISSLFNGGSWTRVSDKPSFNPGCLADLSQLASPNKRN